ncbi:hypothetical protein chiPu_0019428 [Chiloscyllium punctatum]|uniref:Uncharacterized protein n=1 Tax=Chiloscyllium punctatum TaxID=137246 RepID=A0A401RRU0_CHIPU|nr:hypothetical protein [Chiloscyllium punctatum]
MSIRLLTKQEQKCLHQRQHVEELLCWKQWLDAEEAAAWRMEKQALAASGKELKPKMAKREASEKIPELKETTSVQSNIEVRIRALKGKLKKCKSIGDKLKKEQKKHQKD